MKRRGCVRQLCVVELENMRHKSNFKLKVNKSNIEATSIILDVVTALGGEPEDMVQRG